MIDTEKGIGKKYHKIHTVYKRDPNTKFKTLLEGEFSLDIFDYLKYNQWVFTEKVDGTNIRVSLNEDGLPVYAGRTDKADIPAHLSESLNKTFLNQTETLSEIFLDSGESGFCLYGEGFGPKIQKGGGNYRDTPGFVLFDVRVGDWWLRRNDVEDIATALGLEVVPIIGQGTLLELVNWARDGIKSTWGDFQAEGIVARPMVEVNDRSGRRVITKIKCKDFYKG